MQDIAADVLAEGRDDITLAFAASRSSDLRRYNHPTVREVAAVFVGEKGAPPQNRDIVVWPREEAQHRISELNNCVDPLTYALLFPDSCRGWHSNLKHDAEFNTKKNIRVTAVQFYSHRILVRDPANYIMVEACSFSSIWLMLTVVRKHSGWLTSA